VRRCGVCGSDLHWFLGKMPCPSACPGHEISGVVDAVGDGVERWAAGDRVVVEPLRRCGQCARCLSGDYHLCAQLGIFGVTADGGMATHLLVPAYCLHSLPEQVDFEVGALCEPLAVAVHSLRLAAVGPQSRVLVLGAGTVGLLTAVAARHLGVAHVAITARYDHQRRTARRLGCDEILDPAQPRGEGPRPTVVIETVGGHADTIGDAVRCVSRAGTVVMVGLFDVSPRFDPMLLLVKEVRLMGANVYNHPAGASGDFEVALEILASRTEELRALVTHVFPLDRARDAFEAAADKSTSAVKVLLEP